MDESGSRPERARTVTWEDPMIAAAQAPAMSGIEYLKMMARGDLPLPPLMVLLGMEIGEITEGRVSFLVTPAEYHYNPIGVVHGGLACAMLDSAMGCAVHSLLPAATGYTTLELKLNFVRALTADTGPVRCIGTVIHLGGRTATAEARLVDEQGTLHAHGTTTCMIFRPSKARGD